MPSKKKIKSPQQLWENLSSIFVNFVETIFFNLGVYVGKHPWRTVILTWIFVLVSCTGLLKFYIEKNPMKLWVPPESDFYQDTNWYIDNFGTNFRLQNILVTADNVLDSEVLMVVSNITNEINSIRIKHKDVFYSVEDLCFKIPKVNILNSNGKSRSENDEQTEKKNSDSNDFSDPGLWVSDDFYCSFLKTFPLTCLQNNILDLWENDPETIRNLTKHDIITKINEVTYNPTTGHPADFAKMLGGIERDKNGLIVSAKSLLINWYMDVNMTAVDLNEVGNLVGTEDWVSIQLAAWEQEFINNVENMNYEDMNIRLYYEAGRSFADVSGQAMFQEMDKLALGIILMFVYVLISVSRFNWLEVRVTLGSVGLLNVGMAYVTAVSWCSILGIPFGPVHSSLPFLLMGLGVDDMFVMNACWKIVMSHDSHKSVPVKIGLMLKHAGVSIVITSFTDIVALLIGAITILPSLKSFCMYAAMGVFFIFCYSVTFYVAVFTLDLKRIEAKRNGFFFCYKHKNEVAISTEKTICQKLLESFYKNVVFTIPGKTIVILFTLIMSGVSIEAILKLEQRFDPKWFIPEDTYYKDFINKHELYYPDEGQPAMVFMGKMNYSAEFPNLYNMVQRLRNESYVTDVITWVEHFHGYVLQNHDRDLKNASAVSPEDFNKYLSRFLFSSVGGRFQINFKFSQPLECGFPVPEINACSMAFRFIKFNGPDEYIPAMNNVKHIVKSANISTGNGYRSVWSKAFANWVTDEIIAVEVERNIELALICVMVCTIILITNLQMCLWIFICVLITIINVLGWMQRWGMTVDIVCCIGLELAIGLCVDYAAHVGHSFLTFTQGSRHDRAFKTVTSIGTAVLLGGGSTMLSLSLLSMSKAYTFQSFFKIFLLVILFGLFSGLLFLPVVLSLIGPAGYKNPSDDNHGIPEAVELNGKCNDKEKQIDDS
ncbi:protein patched homolog 3-like [Colias croceus]|uniref:protein patched homolog 3-like n=1 Tax=Colias crocea TaxID=72248 RepID=UPI001E280B21|nr:protein patched homolog 3-like [Colias croceus]